MQARENLPAEAGRGSRDATLRRTLLGVAVTLAVLTGRLSAFAQDHQATDLWSLQPLTDPGPPPVEQADWPRAPLDRFVLAQLEARDLHPVAEASRRVWLRRVSFDLTGLPPTPDEVAAFLQDESPDAYERVVDRLLASPHFGERWARHWMDIARYGEDQAHDFKPRLYPQGYRYRDWLIGAFNDDLPYDRFLMAQIAGDLLEEPGRKERLPALGFFALGPVYYGGNKQKEMDELEDRIDTFARGMLGLTVACARCHDHKFDPVSMEDFYGLAGIFASSKYAEVPLDPPEVVERYEQAQKQIAALEEEIESLQEEIKQLKEENDTSDTDGEEAPEALAEARKRLAKREQRLDTLSKEAPPKYAYCHAWVDAEEPSNVPVYERGNVDSPGDQVPRRFLQALDGDRPQAFAEGSGRLQLARQVASPENPLTARVIVNRVWHRLFGQGIVATPSNFGLLGAKPTHPELLDHLASELIEGGWSLKRLMRMIVLSSTYRLSSEYDAANYAHDSANTWLWRMNRRRLDVEAWRDAMLHVSGQLDPTIGGPSQDLADADNRRRTVYAKISRHDLNSLLRLFDFPDPNVTSGSRTETTVPLQQLFVLNSQFMVRQARALAARLQADGSAESAGEPERIRRAFLLAYGRPPSEQEIELGRQFLREAEATAAAADSETAETGSGLTPWEQYAQVLLSANEFLYLD